MKVSLLIFSFAKYSWLALTWLHGHVVEQNKSKMSLAFCKIIEPNFQKTFSLLSNMTANDVRCKPRSKPGRFPFTKNFRKFRWKFPSGENRVPFNSGPFAAQWLRFYAPKFKNVAVNSLEVVRPFKSCKWNTHFQRENRTTFSEVPFIPEIFQWNEPKTCVHLHPNRNFRNF